MKKFVNKFNEIVEGATIILVIAIVFCIIWVCCAIGLIAFGNL